MGDLLFYPTPFIGRRDELAQIGALLADPACRLLTLVGPGGIGKTRLALEVARQQQFPDGVHFVSLQSLTSGDDIASAITNGLGLQFYSNSEPKQQLVNYFRERSLLLVLDSLEQLLDGVTLVSEILAAAPRIRLLATSRERLSLREEWVLEVGGLSYPADDADVDIERYSAVVLFVQHAQRAKANFRLSDGQRPAVARICRLVEGMPLGIELAAAWVRALPPETIAEEIGRSLNILETPARNVEARHRTMRAALDPTWVRLTDVERDAFMKLSVFRGGFTREAAEAVAGATLRTLTGLVDKSLVRVDANGRYDLHELLRKYGAEKLLDAGETEAASAHHLDYFLKLTEQVEAHNFGRGQLLWYDRAETELDNLRAALARSADTEDGLRLAAALGWFFSDRCLWNEGLTWLERVLAANPSTSSSLRAKALCSATALAGNLADHQRAQALGEQALAAARAADDRRNIAWSLNQLAIQGTRPDGQEMALLEKSLALFRELDDPLGMCDTLIGCGFLAHQQKNFILVRRLAQEASVLAYKAGDKKYSAWVAFLLGHVAQFYDQDLPQARMYFETSLSLFRELDFRYRVATLTVMLAYVELLMEHHSRAETLYREALHLQRDWMLYNEIVEDTLVGLAVVVMRQGRIERSVRLLGASDSGSRHYALTNYPIADFRHRSVAKARAELGEDAFAEAWATGKAMTRAQAIAYALEDTADTETGRSQPSTVFLTERELEVLRLVADGLSNSDIADQLVLARSTVKWYVRQIFSKLEATSRTQAVAHARSVGLLR